MWNPMSLSKFSISILQAFMDQVFGTYFQQSVRRSIHYGMWLSECFNVDRCTHRYFIEELSESLHPKVMLCSRYISFQQSLLNCDKFPVKFLASLNQCDQRTLFGRSLRRIASKCGTTVQQIPSKSFVKENMKYFPVPVTESWRPSLLKNLLEIRSNRVTLPGFSSNEVDEMIKFVSIS